MLIILIWISLKLDQCKSEYGACFTLKIGLKRRSHLFIITILLSNRHLQLTSVIRIVLQMAAIAGYGITLLKSHDTNTNP